MTGSDDLARDLTQETFIRVFDKIHQFRGDAAFSTWLRSIATSVIYNGLRKVKRFRQREFDLDEARGMGSVDRRADPDVKEKLWRAIDDLPAKYRMVFVMHDVEGYTHDEISSAMGSQVGTSKAQLSRARAKLREALSEFAGEWAS
jgi:RNA polymerase sigma-70 factor (ECF subfamily)